MDTHTYTHTQIEQVKGENAFKTNRFIEKTKEETKTKTKYHIRRREISGRGEREKKRRKKKNASKYRPSVISPVAR